MEEKHRKIYANLLAAKPEARESIEAVLEKQNALTQRFQKDIHSIEQYLAKNKSRALDIYNAQTTNSTQNLRLNNI